MIKISQWNNAIIILCRAIALRPNDSTLYEKRALCHGKLDEHWFAYEDYTTSFKLNPKNPGGRIFTIRFHHPSHLNLGYYNNLFGKYDKGEYFNTLYIQQKESDNDELEIAYNNRGFSYGRLGKHIEALRDYHKAIEMNPKYIVGMNHIFF